MRWHILSLIWQFVSNLHACLSLVPNWLFYAHCRSTAALCSSLFYSFEFLSALPMMITLFFWPKSACAITIFFTVCMRTWRSHGYGSGLYAFMHRSAVALDSLIKLYWRYTMVKHVTKKLTKKRTNNHQDYHGSTNLAQEAVVYRHAQYTRRNDLSDGWKEVERREK